MRKITIILLFVVFVSCPEIVDEKTYRQDQKSSYDKPIVMFKEDKTYIFDVDFKDTKKTKLSFYIRFYKEGSYKIRNATSDLCDINFYSVVKNDQSEEIENRLWSYDDDDNYSFKVSDSSSIYVLKIDKEDVPWWYEEDEDTSTCRIPFVK